jgi:hypothetical protein
MSKIVIALLVAIAVSACSTFDPYVENDPYAENSQQNYYTVQPSDNLYSIAFILELTPGELRRANPWIDPVYIPPGTRLLVPDYPPDDNYEDDNENYDSDLADNRIQHTNYIWPLNRVEVSSPYGRRRGRMHAGIDLRAPRGTPIYASASGKVIFSGYNRGYGHLIVIDHGRGIETAYAHNNRNIAKKGQRVKQGQVVATVGRSGNATGYHVHFEFRRNGRTVNPIRLLHAAL